MRLLEHEMSLESQKNEMKRHEAWRVYGALLVSYFSYQCNMKIYLLQKSSQNSLLSVVSQLSHDHLCIVFQHAAGQCIYGILKMFPALPSPPCHGVWGKSERVNTLAPGEELGCYLFFFCVL